MASAGIKAGLSREAYKVQLSTGFWKSATWQRTCCVNSHIANTLPDGYVDDKYKPGKQHLAVDKYHH